MMPDNIHEPRGDVDNFPPDEVVEEWSRGCRCCSTCWEYPCAGCCAGGICDDMPCRCDDDSHDLQEDEL